MFLPIERGSGTGGLKGDFGAVDFLFIAVCLGLDMNKRDFRSVLCRRSSFKEARRFQAFQKPTTPLSRRKCGKMRNFRHFVENRQMLVRCYQRIFACLLVTFRLTHSDAIERSRAFGTQSFIPAFGIKIPISLMEGLYHD